jgi:hypothetical protein
LSQFLLCGFFGGGGGGGVKMPWSTPSCPFKETQGKTAAAFFLPPLTMRGASPVTGVGEPLRVLGRLEGGDQPRDTHTVAAFRPPLSLGFFSGPWIFLHLITFWRLKREGRGDCWLRANPGRHPLSFDNGLIGRGRVGFFLFRITKVE